jgi:hypothetical protein
MKAARHHADSGLTLAEPRAQDARPGPPGMAEPAKSGAQSRSLLLLERTMYREGTTPFTSVFTIRLRGVLSQSRLHQALSQVQAKHPLLRCVVENSADGPRFVLSSRPAPIPLRVLERRTENDWQAEIRREWITPFHAGREPLIRLVWLRGGEFHELMLVGHHCICDGQSGVTLIRECLSAYDNPEQDLGAYSFLGETQDLIPAELLRKTSFRLRVGWKMRLLRLALLLKGRKRPSGGKRIAPDQLYFHRWQIDQPTAHALSLRCRSEGVTVFAAVSIAVLQAFRDVRGKRALTKAYAMVNARRFLPRLHTDAMFGIAPGVTLSLKCLPPQMDMSINGFWDRTRLLRTDLTRRIGRLGADFYEYLVGLESLHDKYPQLVADTEAPPAVRHITLSNMGRVDLPQQYQDFRVEEVYSPLVMVSPSPANTLVISSFAGRLEFSIISDEQALPQEQAMVISERTMEILNASVEAPPNTRRSPTQQEVSV